MSPRKAGTVLSYVYILLTNTVSIFYTPIFLSMLGKNEYGLIGTASSLTAYLGLLSMGVGGAYIKFNADARAKKIKEEEYKVNGMFQTIYFFISLLTLIVGLVLIICSSFIFSAKYSYDEITEIKLIMLCTVLQFVVTFCFNTTAMALQAYEKYLFLKLCQIFAAIIQPLINILVLYLGGRAVSISVASLSVSIVTYIIYYVFARKYIGLKFVFRGFDKAILKGIFIFSSFLFLNSITGTIESSTDTMVLAVTRGSAAVAVYTVGRTFSTYFTQFSTSVSGVFAPQINKIVAEKDNPVKLDEIFIKVGRIQFYIVSLILTGYIFFGRQFIVLWVTNDYEDSYLIGLLLILSLFVPCFQNVGIEIQKAKNLQKGRSIAYVIMDLANILLTIPFAIWWGGIGAALATLICVFLGSTIFMNIYNHKKVGLDIISFWKSIFRILPGLILPVAVGLCINFFASIDSYLTLLCFILLYCVVYFVSCWFISMNRYEKDLFIKPIKKIFRRKKVNINDKD